MLQIVSYCVWDSRRSYWHNGLYNPLRRIVDMPLRDLALDPKWIDLKTLCRIRLVSRALCRAATLAIQANRAFIARPDLPALSERVQCVIDTTYNPKSYHSLYCDIKGFHLYFEQFSLANPYGDTDPCAMFRLFAPAHQEMMSTIPQMLPALVNLESLYIQFPRWRWTLSGGTGRWQITIGEAGPQIDWQDIDDATMLVSKCLQLPFTHLRSLRLEMSCTHDFRILADSVPIETFQQLRHLHLETTDEKSCLSVVYPGDPIIVESPDFVVCPHDEYASAVFEIVGRCTQLKTLCIIGAMPLSAESSEWNTPSSGLEMLYLSNVKIGAKRLMKLMSPRQGSASPLHILFLDSVQLLGGVWEGVFNFLIDNAFELDLFYPRHLTYSPPHVDPESVPEQEWYGYVPFLNSTRKDDIKALRVIVRLVYEQGKGCEYNRDIAEELTESIRGDLGNTRGFDEDGDSNLSDSGSEVAWEHDHESGV